MSAYRAKVHLARGHVQPVWAGHPWVFAQAIARVEGTAEHGGEVDLYDVEGHELGSASWSSGSAIRCRIFSREVGRSLDHEFLVSQLKRAAERRRVMGLGTGKSEQLTNGYRLVHGEGDGLPGLIVDRFDQDLVVQLGTMALHRRREQVLSALVSVFSPRAIIDRTSEKAAKSEGFEPQLGLAYGKLPEQLQARELGLDLHIPWQVSQKTGYYFDQRPLRARIEELCANKSVLDTYCFTGTLGLLAKRGGASRVLCVDSSAPALELAAELSRKNSLEIELERGDALKVLKREAGNFEVTIADPPKLAQKRADRDRAMKAFRQIAAAAVGATKPGGLTVLSSCSAALGFPEVERCLALGARDQGRQVTVVERLFQGPDHPVPPAFPEGLYLSTVLAICD